MLNVVAVAFALVIVLGMLTLIASVVVGAITVGNLWLLLPLSIYAVVFWGLAQMGKDM